MKEVEVDKMAYYKICPRCHAALDPGERCECEEEAEQKKEERAKRHQDLSAMLKVEKNGQFRLAV